MKHGRTGRKEQKENKSGKYKYKEKRKSNERGEMRKENIEEEDVTLTDARIKLGNTENEAGNTTVILVKGQILTTAPELLRYAYIS
jgi:hypothetical protein